MSFADIRRAWRLNPRYKKEEQYALNAYKAHIVADSMDAELLAGAIAYTASVPEGEYPPIGLDSFIRRALEEDGVILEMPKAAVVTPAMPAKLSTPRKDRGDDGFTDKTFVELWAWWQEVLVNPERREYKRTAYETWLKAVKKYAPEDLTAAAHHYCKCFLDPQYKMAFPMLFKRFFSSSNEFEVLEDWLHRVKYTPSDEDLNAFWVTYEKYPDKGKSETKIKADLALYVRHVEKDQRLAFYLATCSYAEKRKRAIARKPDDERYTKGFARFVAEWGEENFSHYASWLLGRCLYDAILTANYDKLWVTADGRELNGPQYQVVYSGVAVAMQLHKKNILQALKWAIMKTNAFNKPDTEEVLDYALGRAGLDDFATGADVLNS